MKKPFCFRTIEIAPGDTRPIQEEDWLDTLVIIECGDLELTCHLGGNRRFEQGAMLWLTGLELKTLSNPGSIPTRLLTVARSLPPQGGTRGGGTA